MWPVTTTTPRCQYIDTNHTLKRSLRQKAPCDLLKDGYAGPWKDVIPTVTAMSRIVFRLKLSDDERNFLNLEDGTTSIMRCITGKEAFQLLGFEPDEFKVMCDESLAWSFVGNAMSTYSLLPLYLALFACLGKEHTPHHHVLLVSQYSIMIVTFVEHVECMRFF